MEIKLPKGFEWVDTSDPNFNRALVLGLNSDRNLFCQGRAGAGKSLLIKILSTAIKNTVVLSTTGITAVELSSDKIAAKTIHSFFNLPPFPIIRDEDIMMMAHKSKAVLNKANLIIIDEVSMMSNNLFDKLCEKIIQHRDDKEIPRMILFGDVMQLPPVIQNDPAVIQYYKDEYNGNVMFFNGEWFNRLDFKTVNLRKSYRQDDQDFADRLLEIGFKDHTNETLEFFNSRIMSLPQFERQHKQYIYMAPTNGVVNKMNDAYMKTLTGKSQLYKARMNKNYPKNKILFGEEVLIREGAQIMCLMNKYDPNPENSYSNGMIGTVLDLNKDEVIMELPNGQKKKIGKTTTYIYETDVRNGRIEYNPIHWFEQIDCKICKAITVHKSQGKSFNTAYLSLQGWTPPGLTYVGLSRLRTLDGLGLSRQLKADDIQVNMESYEFLTQ